MYLYLTCVLHFLEKWKTEAQPTSGSLGCLGLSLRWRMTTWMVARCDVTISACVKEWATSVRQWPPTVCGPECHYSYTLIISSSSPPKNSQPEHNGFMTCQLWPFVTIYVPTALSKVTFVIAGYRVVETKPFTRAHWGWGERLEGLAWNFHSWKGSLVCRMQHLSPVCMGLNCSVTTGKLS